MSRSELPCLSVGGMRSWIVQDKHKEDGGFLDPLSREGRDSEGSKSILTIPDDYKMFSIYGNKICILFFGPRQTPNPSTLRKFCFKKLLIKNC